MAYFATCPKKTLKALVTIISQAARASSIQELVYGDDVKVRPITAENSSDLFFNYSTNEQEVRELFTQATSTQYWIKDVMLAWAHIRGDFRDWPTVHISVTFT